MRLGVVLQQSRMEHGRRISETARYAIGTPKQKGPVPANGSFESYKAKTIQQPLRLPLQP